MDTTKTESSVDHKDKRVKHSKNHQLKKNIIHLANELLDICRSKPYSDSSKVLKNKPLIDSIPDKIRSLRQLKSNVFIYFYEIICDAELVDKKWPAVSIDDEVHNIQAVIDSLSLDILHEDLSYLTGESILGLNSVNNKPDLTSIEYLLDILRCVHEWISSRIETTTDVTKTVTEITPNPEPPTQHVQEAADYADLNEKIHQTLQMTKNSLFNQTNPDYREEDDVFKSYMRQKEHEYKLTKTNSVDNSADNSRPLSAIETNDEIIELVNQTSQTNEMKPNMKPYMETIDNELALIRKNLEHNLYLNDKNVNQFLEQVYNQDLEDAKTLQQAELNRVMKKCQLTNELYESAYVNGPSVRVENPPLPFKPNLKVSRSSRSKGVLLPRNKSLTNYAPVKRRSSSMSQLEKTQRLTRRAQSASTGAGANPRKQFLSRFLITEEGILNCLLQEFPYLYTSPETIHYLWQRHSKQIQTMTKNYKEFKDNFFRTEQKMADSENEDTSQYSNTGKNKVREHLKETYRKQKMLMDLMRDDLEHTQRLQDSKRKQLLENSMKAKMREDRFRSAKVKRYMDEFRLQQRARMLKQSTSEELIFKRLFNESIKLQKERMLELKKYAKEKNDIYMKKQLNQIESIENMYKNKFNLLNEKFINEKNEALNREKAQHLILSKMNKNVKTKLESDIRDLQDQLYRDKDFLHWRQLDAEKIKNQLVKANYVTLNK